MPTSPFHEVAHLGHVELLTPEPEVSLRFFTEIMGLRECAREGDSVYLRTYDDYEHHSLILTGHETSGLRKTALRSWSADALKRRVAAIEEAGYGIGWREGGFGIGRTYAFRDPDGHEFELYWESEHYRAPESSRAALKNQAEAKPSYGVGVRRLDHVNFLARPRSSPTASSSTRSSVPGPPSRSGSTTAASPPSGTTSATSPTTSSTRRTGPAAGAGCTTSPSPPTPARRSCAPPTSSWTTASSSRPGRTSTRSSRRSSSTSTSPAATASNCATRSRLILAPDWEPITWTEEEREEGPGLGAEDDRVLPHARADGAL
jgi:catechol 2,3-dioxygenase